MTGIDATSRSRTFTPAALSPAIIDRLSMRADRLESREVTTVASFLSVVPNAMATRVASSGVTSTLASPDTPSRPNRLRAPRDSHTIDELMTAPPSTVLKGYTFTPAVRTACSPTKHSSPSTTPSSARTPVRRSHERPTVVPRRRTFSPM